MKTKKNLKNNVLIFFILISVLFIVLSFYYVNPSFKINNERDDNRENTDNLNISAIDASVNLTNANEIDGRMFIIGSSIDITGTVIDELPFPDPLEDVTVILTIDGTNKPSFNNITNAFGEFTITYTIETSLDVYLSHTIEVDVPALEIYLYNSYTIDINSTSTINITKGSLPYLAGEILINTDFSGNILLQNNDPIPSAELKYNWYSISDTWSENTIYTDIEGDINAVDFSVPTDASPESINLNITMVRIPNIAEPSNTIIPNIEIFTDLDCLWDIYPSSVTEGDQITIGGYIVDLYDDSRYLNNRHFSIRFGTLLVDDFTDTFETDGTGWFSYSFTIPSGSDNKTVRISLVEYSSVYDFDSSIDIEVLPYIPPPPPEIPLTPLQLFFIIGVPIIIGSVTVVSIFIYKKYKTKLSTFQTVKIPLESKIQNLKILKDSNRIEESLSYLFNAIYIDLVGAKYGRIRKENETIRDFAIISVKDFKLDPTKIYPFIQKVEQIIYARPFQVTDKEFYDTVNLFSPIYHQLTGYNFILNF